jgi:zinc protease
MREKAGASYTPQVYSEWPLDIDSGGKLVAMVQVQPDQAETFFDIAERIAADLAASGPTADELSRASEPLAQLITRAQTGHTFWLNQLQGTTRDPNIAGNLRSLMRDYTQTGPLELQLLAMKYFVPQDSVKIAVLPREAK